jgi:hypothetical protein
LSYGPAQRRRAGSIGGKREELRQQLAKCAEQKRAARDRVNLARSKVFDLNKVVNSLAVSLSLAFGL